MKATDFHVAHNWQRRVVDLSDFSGAAGWRAAQAFAREGAQVYLPEASGRERARRFDDLARERGLGNLILQEGSVPSGTIIEMAADASLDPERPRPGVARAGEDPVGAHTLLARPDENTGHVTLVGGGPGETGLLTLAALEAIAHADVVFLDRLGIALNVFDLAPGALVIDVGKTPGRHKLSQERINEEMFRMAEAGAHIVRLKGGDVFIFGRGGEEWRYLAERDIPVSVVPGITSALSVPAHAGVSATYRNVTRAVTIVSGHQPFNQAELGALVVLGGTVVILMGVGTFPSTVAGLLEAGLPPETGVALLEEGYTPRERHTFTTLGAALADADARQVKNPAIIVIGDVVRWREPSAHLPDPEPGN